MKLETGGFMSRGYIIRTDDGFICKSAKFKLPASESSPETYMNNAVSALAQLRQENLELDHFMVELDWNERYPGSFKWEIFPDMLRCFFEGKPYVTPLFRAGVHDLYIGMSEIQFRVDFYDDERCKSWSFSCGPIVIPIGKADCEMVFADKERPNQEVRVVWKNGLLASIG